MNIGAMQRLMQTENVLSPASSNIHSKPISFAEHPKSDRVTISDEARQKLQESSLKNLEEYQVPSWLADVHPILINGDIGIVDGQGNPLSRSQIFIRGGNLQPSSDLDEYHQIVTKHYQDALKDNKITNVYQDIILNPEQGEKVKNDFYSRLTTDDRAKELMRQFGISLS